MAKSYEVLSAVKKILKSLIIEIHIARRQYDNERTVAIIFLRTIPLFIQ